MTRVILHAGSWLPVLAAILLGVAGAAIAILAAIAVTGGRSLATVAGSLAVVLGTGGLSWLPVAVTGVTLVVVVTVTGLLVFAPAPSYTAITTTDDTRYWELRTGSQIAYMHTPTQGATEHALCMSERKHETLVRYHNA